MPEYGYNIGGPWDGNTGCGSFSTESLSAPGYYTEGSLTNWSRNHHYFYMRWRGIQVHLNGGCFETDVDHNGVFFICSWYDGDLAQQNTGYYSICSKH